jgi:hypothetical protein
MNRYRYHLTSCTLNRLYMSSTYSAHVSMSSVSSCSCSLGTIGLSGCLFSFLARPTGCTSCSASESLSELSLEASVLSPSSAVTSESQLSSTTALALLLALAVVCLLDLLAADVRRAGLLLALRAASTTGPCVLC